jgi:hypothetical protein
MERKWLCQCGYEMSFFGKKSPFGVFRAKCPIETRKKIWIEQCFSYLCQTLGLESLLQANVLLPTDEFLSQFDGSEKSAGVIFNKLCLRMGLSTNEIQLAFAPKSEIGPGQSSYEYDDQSATIYVVDFQLNQIHLAAASMIQQLCRHLLNERTLFFQTELQNELVADILSVFLGLGILGANATLQGHTYVSGNLHQKAILRQGYATALEFGYAHALFAWIGKESLDCEWQNCLRPDARQGFRLGLSYLRRTSDCVFSPTGVEDAHEIPQDRLVAELASSSESTKVAALWAVRRCGRASPAIVEAIRGFLQNRSELLQNEAIAALGAIGMAGRQTLPFLLNALESRRPKIRAIAVAALAQLGCEPQIVLPNVAALLHDDSREVVLNAVGCIGEYGFQANRLNDALLTRLRESLVDHHTLMSKNNNGCTFADDF